MRGEHPDNAAGIGEFWYEPEVWSLPISLRPRPLCGPVLLLGHREINRKDLRNTLKGSANAEILAQAFEELVRRNLLRPTSQRPGGILPEYAVQSVSECEG